MSETIHISQRLKNVASFIPKGARFVDIGSDHAYLPCYVCKHDTQAEAIAGEIAESPFKHARKTVERLGLFNRIEVRLGNGLEVIEGKDADIVIIAGMGGLLITEILDEGKHLLGAVKRIIIQPNVDEPVVREWLSDHRYAITKESIVEEKGHVYEIIVADKLVTMSKLTDRELFFGPYLLRHRTDTFYRKWRHEYRKRQQILNQMKLARNPDKVKMKTLQRQSKWIEEVLYNGCDST